jgi:hypothetical protein
MIRHSSSDLNPHHNVTCSQISVVLSDNHLFNVPSCLSNLAMRLSTLILSALLLLGACAYAAPAPQATSNCTEEPATTTPAAPITSPTAPYTVMSARSGMPVHLLPMQARGFNFYLGGSPAVYCPQPPVTSCPSGETTIFNGLGGLVGFQSPAQFSSKN